MATGRWCFRPRPLPNELLSSWLHRLALANATRDHTLCKTMWPDAEVWTRDLDRSLRTELLTVLADWTGVSVSTLSHMQLMRWVGRLSETMPPRGHAAWLLPVGVYHRIRRRHGLMFCPACLRESDADALWMWRMAWTVCCRRHRAYLLDACPACSKPYIPFRSAPSLLGRMPCSFCGIDLARIVQLPAPVWAWQFQQRMETALVEGRTQIGGRSFFALALFTGLRSLAALLLLNRQGRELAASTTTTDPEITACPRGAAIELHGIASRRWIMKAAWNLLQDWPETFVKLARRVDYRHHFAERISCQWVFWMAEGIDRLPGCRQRQLDVVEAQAVSQWLLRQNETPTWNRILSAAGVSTPTRVPQPAVSHVLERISKHREECDEFVSETQDPEKDSTCAETASRIQ